MKKTVTFLTAALMIFALTACGSKKTANETESINDSQSGDKVLIAYYSATGNTKGVAEYIARETGGDLFELTPVNPYTDADLNWNADGSRVNVEHDDESKRDIELVNATPDNFEDYDIVYIGYPKMEYGFSCVSCAQR